MTVKLRKTVIVVTFIFTLMVLIPALLSAGFKNSSYYENNNSKSNCCFQDSIHTTSDNTVSISELIPDSKSISTRDSSKNRTDSTLVSANGKFEPNKFSELTITRQDNSSIKIDGELNEPVWQKIARYNNFSECSPGDNTKPEVKTEVMMYYDDNNLYFGFICYENDMTKVRKTLADRDHIFQDDFVGFFLDTYKESRQAYELFVTPYGIQGDLMWTTPGNEDQTFDMIWYSAAKEYKDRWTVEIAIPFKSIRFPDRDVQDWQIQFLRIRPRENRYQYSLMPISRDDPTLFTHACAIKGVTNIKGGKNLEVLPYLMTTQSGSISDKDNADSKFVNEKTKGEAGVNIKYGITSTLTADVTVNPDFSQVESDAGVITANNTYAIYYNEKRPFFLEGANIFSSPTQVVYTREINNPMFALKLTGKSGKTEIGILSAYDKKTPFIIPFKESSDFVATNRHSLSNIVRVKHSIKSDDSYIGLVFTDRQVGKEGKDVPDVDGYNRNYGIDGKYRFLKNFSLDFQVLHSESKEINYSDYNASGSFDHGRKTKALDGESFSGMQYYAALYRDARAWSYNVQFNANSPNVRKDNGYLSSNDNITISTWQGYMFYPETKFITRVQPQFYTHLIHDYAGNLREKYFQLEVWMQFIHQISVDMGFRPVNSEVWGGEYNQGARSGWINLSVNTFDKFTFGAYMDIGKSIIRNDTPAVGYKQAYSFWSTFKPINSIVMSNSWDYYELATSYGGEKLYAGYIFRDVTTYNITKEISLRFIGEYNSFSGGFYFNPLASYKPNPFTIFYFGFTNSYENLNTPENKMKYVMTDRQFFLKMQYLFRI
ncbi:MAG: DUF5916 domain-containing protein [Ignavibacteria bacterium]|nr:DUF5916 domain-containing protein [Ignavibacteria bacterium]